MAEEDGSPIWRRVLESYDKDSVLEYLSQLARKLGKDSLTCDDVEEDGQIHPGTIMGKFGGFSKVLIEAGLKPGRIYNRDSNEMIQELAGLMNQLRREPKKSEINEALNYKARSYELEFGSMKKAFDLAQDTMKAGTTPEVRGIPAKAVPIQKKIARRRYGPEIGFRSLKYAPMNKLGVVFLFGILAEELGFHVESIEADFPACDAKFKTQNSTSERVTIEFEFKSSEFVRHGHGPYACNYLVCWQHDWKDCPDSLTVIELSKKIERRKR